MTCTNCRDAEATATVDLDGVPEEVCESCAAYMVDNMGGVRRLDN